MKINKQPVPKIPFKEALKAFEDKIILPTKHWSDIPQKAHARAFMVTGAMKHDLLSDIQGEVKKHLNEGLTIQDFRKSFKEITKKYGWYPNNKNNWRADIIYQTNMSQAYNAGREARMQELKEHRPYAEYVAVLDSRTRSHHRELHGQVHHLDSYFWEVYTPSNGWRCRCLKRSISKEAIQSYGLEIEPMIDNMDQIPKTHKIVKVNGKAQVMELPQGVAYGFDYNPGKASFGQILPKEAFEQKKLSLKGQKEWHNLSQGNWESYGRPKIVPIDKPTSRLFKPIDKSLSEAAQKEQMRAYVKKSLNMKEDIEVINTAAGKLVVDAKLLADHLPINRAPHTAFLKELLDKPFEVWQNFEENRITGKIEIRKRYIKALELSKDQGLTIIGNSYKSQITGWTFIPVEARNLKKYRIGEMLLGR